MPELPEVETVCRGMAPVLVGQRLTRAEARRADLRVPFPPDLAQRLVGARVTAVTRRAKYAQIHTDRDDVMLLHLGMSGRVILSAISDAPFDKHDHLVLETAAGGRLVLNDARRFGMVDLVGAANLAAHPWLAALGPEPLGPALTPAFLMRSFHGKTSPVKSVLLDQRVIAGLGNIYVCEALFKAGISPLRAAGTISRAKLARLAEAIRTVLERAIEVGGSSLRDYVQVDGELGYFQHEWTVYGREGAPCRRCGRIIGRTVQSGRSTFFCGACQR
jgi:formamidopyrimidine-DNA glycosylase